VALLHNDQNEPVKVRQVEVNGHKLSAWPKPTNPVAWQRLTRQTLEPGQSGVLQAKLVQRIHGAIRVNMTVGGEDLTSLVNASAADPVHVTAVRFGPEGERINVFVRNNGSKPETLKRVRLDHTPVWGVDQGPLAIQPGKTNVVRLSLEEPLEAAERILLRLELKDRSLAVTDRATRRWPSESPPTRWCSSRSSSSSRRARTASARPPARWSSARVRTGPW
jgi:hypothetical protein